MSTTFVFTQKGGLFEYPNDNVAVIHVEEGNDTLYCEATPLAYGLLIIRDMKVSRDVDGNPAIQYYLKVDRDTKAEFGVVLDDYSKVIKTFFKDDKGNAISREDFDAILKRVCSGRSEFAIAKVFSQDVFHRPSAARVFKTYKPFSLYKANKEVNSYLLKAKVLVREEAKKGITSATPVLLVANYDDFSLENTREARKAFWEMNKDDAKCVNCTIFNKLPDGKLEKSQVSLVGEIYELQVSDNGQSFICDCKGSRKARFYMEGCRVQEDRYVAYNEATGTCYGLSGVNYVIDPQKPFEEAFVTVRKAIDYFKSKSAENKLFMV